MVVVQRMQGVGLALTVLVASAAPSQAYRAVISQELTISPPSFLSLVPDSLLGALGDQLFNELSVGDGFSHTVSKTDTGVRVDVHVYDPTIAGELEVAMAAFGAEQATAMLARLAPPSFAELLSITAVTEPTVALVEERPSPSLSLPPPSASPSSAPPLSPSQPPPSRVIWQEMFPSGACRTAGGGAGTFDLLNREGDVVQGAASCETACSANPLCVAFELGTNHWHCELHWETITRTSGSDYARCFVKAPPAPPFSPTASPQQPQLPAPTQPTQPTRPQPPSSSRVSRPTLSYLGPSATELLPSASPAARAAFEAAISMSSDELQQLAELVRDAAPCLLAVPRH